MIIIATCVAASAIGDMLLYGQRQRSPPVADISQLRICMGHILAAANKAAKDDSRGDPDRSPEFWLELDGCWLRGRAVTAGVASPEDVTPICCTTKSILLARLTLYPNTRSIYPVAS